MDEKNITRQLMFSMITGDIYEIESDELKNMDKYQIPLIKRPSRSCVKCYGRMYSDFNKQLKIYTPCSKCVNRCVDFGKYQEDVEIETTKNA
ncbi:MAG: hypothetical protein WC905_01665 [Patescibacteria group bacterium]|jgi:hypothetical protein